MRTNRRLMALTAGVVAVALTVAACGGSDSSANGDGTSDEISVMTRYTAATPEGQAFQRQVDAFTAKTGIKVDVQEGGESLDDSYETSLAAGKEPDVVSINLFDKTTGWLENGATVDVTKYVDEWGLKDKIEPEALAQWTNADGQVQGFPYSGFSWPVWYNTELLTQAGITAPPATIDELIADAQTLRAAGIGPMAVGGSDWSGQKLFMQIVQQYMPPEQAQTLFAEGGYCDSPEAMQGIDLFIRLRDAGVFVDDVQGYTADLMNTDFYTGKVAIMPAGSWAFGNTPEAERSNIVLGGLPVPTGGQYSEPTAYRGYTGSGWWISPTGEGKLDTVQQFITSFYDPAVVADFVGSGNLVPAAILDDPSAAKNPLLKTAITDLPDTVDFAVMPDIYVPGTVNNTVTQATAAAYGPGTSSQDICAGMDQAYAGA